MSSLLPIVSNLADFYTWKARATIASNVTGANSQTAQIKILADSFFAFFAFRASTNYDNFSGDLRASVGAGPAAATRLGTPPFVPNNFSVEIKRNDTLFSTSAIPQSVLGSNGYRAGAQLPFPILYPPASVFYLRFYNTAPTLLNDNTATAISLEIDFGFFGMNVPVENLQKFLRCWPEMVAAMTAAEQAGRMPGAFITEIDVPGFTAAA